MKNLTMPETGTISLQQSLEKQLSDNVPDPAANSRGFTFRAQKTCKTDVSTMQKLSEEEIIEMNAVTLRNIYRNAGKAIY